MNPGRSINEAAQRLAEAEDWRLTEVAIHDPDMIRDVARAMLAATPVPEITKEPFGYVLTTGMASGYDFVTNKHEADDHMITEAAYKPECIPVWTHQPTDTRAKALEEADKRDAARWRWIEPHFRVFGLHMDGNHHWCATGQIGRITGPTFGAAVDAAITGKP